MDGSIIDILKEAILKFLDNPNYEIVQEKVEKSTTVTKYTSYKIILRAPVYKRRVSCSILDYYTHQRLFFNIYNSDGQSHNPIALDQYLEKSCEIKDASELFLLNAYSGESLAEKLDNLFSSLNSKLNEDFFHILLGNSWVEIPVDWRGYK